MSVCATVYLPSLSAAVSLCVPHLLLVVVFVAELQVGPSVCLCKRMYQLPPVCTNTVWLQCTYATMTVAEED